MPEIYFPDLTQESLVSKTQESIQAARMETQTDGGSPGGDARRDAGKKGPAYTSVSSDKTAKQLKKAEQISGRYDKWPRRLFRNQARIDGLIFSILKPLIAMVKKFDAALLRHDKTLRKMESAARVLHFSVTDLQREYHRLRRQVDVLSGQVEQQREMLAAFPALVAQTEDQAREMARLSAQLGQLQSEMRHLHEERFAASLTMTDSKSQKQEDAACQDQGVGGGLYVAFENLFRGPESVIRDRAQVYLPFVERAKDAAAGLPALDLGCGRGEWLALLKERGIAASGVDLNPAMVAIGREKGLEVTCVGALKHLASLPSSSQSLVTAFHVVEHLSPEDLQSLLQEVSRVLAPGGLAIFETPNPANMMVSTFSFHLDPTHRRPLPPPLLKFLCESSGFSHADILELHPPPTEVQVPVEGAPALAERFNHLFYGPQDFAALAWAPSR